MKRFLILAIFLFVFPVYVFAQHEILALPQADSPLHISGIVAKWTVSKDDKGKEWQMLNTDFVVRNVGRKTVRVYVIRQTDGGLDKTIMSSPTNAKGLIKPKQSRKEEMLESGYDVRPQNIILAVDFVEFTDGTTWGANLAESDQMLGGLRAGAKAVQDYLLERINRTGIDSVAKTLDEPIDISAPKDKSQKWKRGFNTAVRSVKRRVSEVYKKEGGAAAEAVLRNPYFIPSDK